MERTHRLRADLSWLPTSVRRSSQLVRGAAWVGTGVAITATLAVAPAAALLWKGFLLGGAGTIALADRASRSMLRTRLGKMTRGELPLAEVDQQQEGELVVVRGTIEADATVPGMLLDAEGVYRRAVFKARGTWVHEAAVDFTLVDAKGDRIRIEAAGARWLTPARELVSYPVARFLRATAPPRLRELVRDADTIDAYERVLTVGTEVQIAGYKTTTADATGVQRDYRMPPQRATLRSGDELPLVITRLDEYA